MSRLMGLALLVIVFSSPAYSSTVKTIKVSEPRYKARLDLVSLYLRSNRHVDHAEVLDSGYVTVEFKENKGFMFDAVQKCQPSTDCFFILRDYWQEKYMAFTQELKIGFAVPTSVSAFEKLTQFKTWNKETIFSNLKETDRVIYRNKDFKGHVVRVSQAPFLNPHTQKLEVETEVAISFYDDYVFLVYSHDGRLSPTAHFPVRRLKAPLSCTGCHYDQKLRKVREFFDPVE